MQPHLNHAVIRPATPDIADTASKLLFLTMGPLAGYWMGVDEQSKAEAILFDLFQKPNNLFTHELADYAELDGRAVGLQLSYPARWMARLGLRTMILFLRQAGLAGTARLIWRSYPLQDLTRAPADEFFLAHVGVLPDFEGGGLGRRLLARVEERAREAGLSKISLTVDAGNERALRLYHRAGFSITRSASFERLRRRFSYGGYHHMLKVLR